MRWSNIDNLEVTFSKKTERVAVFHRNGGQLSAGIGGRFQPESVAGFSRCTHCSTEGVIFAALFEDKINKSLLML